MYPELEKVGGLKNAIDSEFEKLNSGLRVTRNSDLDKVPLTFALIENGNKFSQVYIAAENHLYLPDFWKEGVCLAHGETDNISNLGQVLDFWLCNDVSTKVLADKFAFVVPYENASAFENNEEVEYVWRFLLKEDDTLGLKEFINLASKDELLNKLFPFTSLYTLSFSRCTGFPFDTNDLPNVTEIEYIHFALPKNTSEYSKIVQDTSIQNKTTYVVTKNKTQYIGQGNAEEALRIVKANLPDNVQPARKGTAED